MTHRHTAFRYKYTRVFPSVNGCRNIRWDGIVVWLAPVWFTKLSKIRSFIENKAVVLLFHIVERMNNFVTKNYPSIAAGNLNTQYFPRVVDCLQMLKWNSLNITPCLGAGNYSVMVYLGDSDSDFGLVVLLCVHLCTVGHKTDFVDMQVCWLLPRSSGSNVMKSNILRLLLLSSSFWRYRIGIRVLWKFYYKITQSL